MTTLNYSALREKAKAEGNGSSDEILPVGEYDGEIIKAGAKAKSAGYALWWQVKVLVGPEAGRVAFLNQQLNPDNGAQLDIFFRVCKDLGIDFDVVPDATPPESIAKLALGRKLHFEIVHNPSKTDATKVFANFKNIKLLDDVEAAVATVAAAPAAVVEAAVEAVVPAAASEAPVSKLPF